VPAPSLPAPSLPAPTTPTPSSPTPTTPAPVAGVPDPGAAVSGATQTGQTTTAPAASTASGAVNSATQTVTGGGGNGSAGGGGTALGGPPPTVAGATLAAFTSAGGGQAAWTTTKPTKDGTYSSSSNAAVTKKRPARPRTIVIRFRSARAGRVGLRIVQVWPSCRPAGLISMRVRPGVNRIRFNGKLGRGWLRDGTYVLVTPTVPVRFAIVNGRPTRKPERFQSSVCPEGAERSLAGLPVALGSGAAGLFGRSGTGEGEAIGVGIEDVGPGIGPLRAPTRYPDPTRVLGATVDEVAEAVTSLHPAFYILLAAAIMVLAAATLPASVVPSPALGAALARRRAEMTLAGIFALVGVIIAYLLFVAV
jgi:hypothetical protein